VRTTDPDPAPWQPLGERVQKTTPASPAPAQAPGAAPGILRGPDGKLRTNLPLPK
jgi:hypothetical protein